MKTLTLEQARADKQTTDLWIVNQTELYSSDGLRDDVFLGVRLQNGEDVGIPVAGTWLPQNLCIHAPRDSIIASKTFLAAVNTGRLAVVDSTTAQLYLNSKEGRAELARLRDIEDSIREASSAKKLNVEVVARSNAASAAAPSLDEEASAVNLTDMVVEESLLDRMNAAENSNAAAAILKSEYAGRTMPKSEVKTLVAGLKHEKLKAALSKLLEA